MEADASQLPRTGDTFGKYRIVRLIGLGGMGAVYEAVHARLGQRVAVKVLLPRFLDKPDIVGRFEREARAASQVRGANVARVVDVDVAESGMPYMVMEFLEGHDLSQELALRKMLPVEEAVDIVLQACAGMAESHSAGIIHRDLKPSNLFLCSDGGARVVKILDFGISKITHETDTALTATETSMGTPLYMSPEQIRSAKHVDARADVWALGVILFELLSGRTPFTGGATAVAAAIVVDDVPSLRAMGVEVPEALERAVNRALAKMVGARYPDVGSFAAALSPFASARGRMASDSGQFQRITLGEGPLLAMDALPTVPAGQAGPAAPVDAVTAVPWTANQVVPERRSKKLYLLALPALALVAGAGWVLSARRSPEAPPSSAVSAAPSAAPAAPPVQSPTPAVSASLVAAPSSSAKPSSVAKPTAKPKPTSAAPTTAPVATENPVKL